MALIEMLKNKIHSNIYLWFLIGIAVFHECPTNWSLVGCMGQEVLPAVDSVLYLCPYPADEDKPMVGVTA